MDMTQILLIIGGYLLGSLSSAVIVCRLMGLPDPRTQGSNNPGATNVLRFGGKKAAAIVLVADMLKGFIPVLIAQLWHMEPIILAGTGVAAFLGHLFPVFFGFRGGKGVATFLGVLLAMQWMVGLAVAGTWLIMAKGFKVSSLSALVAAALAPFYQYWINNDQMLVMAVAFMSVVLIARHHSNIRNLISGKEDKIGTDVES
ncbi:MAG: glycerol-3-phosphate 1-O-acyltransferase PlsY [Gammaproteobacteria bacterium]|nr:glycerol-3-phosphate 1-O-acyltransferase PlsY [Gammaproteobacteria bacterium]